LMPELVSAGYRCYAPDLLGHGESAKPDTSQQYHIEIFYNYLETWFDSQQIKQPAIFIGHSMGGYLSLLFSLRRPELVRGLVLVDPLFSPSQFPPLTGILKHRPEIGVKANWPGSNNQQVFFRCRAQTRCRGLQTRLTLHHVCHQFIW
jgi:pimeloyl-ACP methyl ester carboxylesterase